MYLPPTVEVQVPFTHKIEVPIHPKKVLFQYNPGDRKALFLRPLKIVFAEQFRGETLTSLSSRWIRFLRLWRRIAEL